MAVEIEKKYRLTDEQVGYLEDELARSAADFVGEEFEENTIFGGGVLDNVGAILRIRKVGAKGILTFKKRIDNDSAIKHQIEHESEFSNVTELREIVLNLGFAPRVVYEKIRKTWLFRNVEVVLDELPFGKFMEIEGAVTDIKEAEMVLGIEGFAAENETYPRLASSTGTRVGEVIEARFPPK